MKDERHLISASIDCSVLIWDLNVNQSVGKPLLHDYKLFTLAMSPDEKYIVSAGADANIYVWSLEAALNCTDNEYSGDNDDVQPNISPKGDATQHRDVRTSVVNSIILCSFISLDSYCPPWLRTAVQ